MAKCYNCGAALDDKEVFRTSVCDSCGKDVKVCLNCRHYEPGAHWDCRETIPDPVKEKDRANFCGYFQFSKNTTSDGGSGGKSGERARADFDKLFGNG